MVEIVNQQLEPQTENVDKREKANRRAVRRERAATYLLTSSVAFGITVIAVRLFLDWSGYPQIGNSVLHIAHALWGALLLMIAVLLPLLLANQWSIQVSALLSGIGTGLFIDEVGKFITQKNDYFFPPALPLIYGFFLLTVFLYLYFRRSGQQDARKAMYHALDGLKDIVDGDLDQAEAAHVEAQLALARRSEDGAIRNLAETLTGFLQQERGALPAAKSGFWQRMMRRVDAFGSRVGKRVHRRLIAIMLIFWSLSALLSSALLAFAALGGLNLEDEALRATFSSSELAIVDSPLWLTITAVIQVVIFILSFLATIAWLRHREARGERMATFGLVLSLVLMQPLLFYTQQLAALGGTLYQFAFLLVVLAYRRWYLEPEAEEQAQIASTSSDLKSQAAEILS